MIPSGVTIRETLLQCEPQTNHTYQRRGKTRLEVMNGQQLYERLPRPLQTLALNAYAGKLHLERFGPRFRRELERSLERERWPWEVLQEYQHGQLERLIRHAYESVPFYRRILDERGLTPRDFRSAHDLHKLPLLTREDVRKNISALISTRYRLGTLSVGRTSGTTGSPLQFYWDREMTFMNNVVDWRQKATAGLRYGQPHAVLFGRMIVPVSQRKPPFWRMNYLHNQLWLSTFHISTENLEFYLRKLRSFRPRVLEGYPSTVQMLAQFLDQRGERLPLGAVLTTSETLRADQRELIERVFECRVFDFYGLAERVIFATECEKHEGHHVNLDYGIMEITNDTGEPVAEGELGWIVGTSLHNLGMPFLRYQTGDVTRLRMHRCSCGRTFPVMDDVTTKAEDIIVTKDGRFISPSVLTHPFKPLQGIAMSQIIQEDRDHLTVKIVRAAGFRDEQGETLVRGLQERLGEEMRIRLEFVDEIPRSGNGKFKWVVSKVPFTIQ